MKRLVLLALFGMATTWSWQESAPPSNWQTERMGTPSVTPNGYGLGVNSDTHGRPHVYRTQDGTAVDPIFQDGVKRNGYGAGVHQDQFGRPVCDSAP